MSGTKLLGIIELILAALNLAAATGDTWHWLIMFNTAIAVVLLYYGVRNLREGRS